MFSTWYAEQVLPAAPPLSPDAEADRLATLRRYGVLGSPPTKTFDRLAQLAAGSLGVAGAAISFVGEQRVFYKAFFYQAFSKALSSKALYSAAGQTSRRSFPRSQTLCAAAAFAPAPLVFENLAEGVGAAERLNLAFVRQNGVRFYVGVPLTAPDGAVLGTLSVFDVAPRTPKPGQLELLATLAQTVLELLEQQREALARAEATKADTQLGELLEHAPYYAFTASADGRLDYLNDTLKRALGYPSPPEHYRALYAEDVQDEVAAAFHAALKQGRAELCTTLQTHSGALIPVSQTLTRLARAGAATDSATGSVKDLETGVSVAAYDTSAQRQRDVLEQKRADVLELTARGAPLPAVLLELIKLLETSCRGLVGAVFLVHEGTLQLEVAPQLPSAFAQLVRELPLSRVAAAPGAAVLRGQRVLSSDIRRDPLWHHQRYYALQNGLQACWAEPILSDQQEVLGTFVLYAYEPKLPTETEGRLLRETAQLAAIAVSRQKLYAQLEHQAHYDALTGLPNRRLLGEHLERAVRQAQAQGEQGGVGVFLLDLDDFKRVNDALGHAAGDALLSAVAERLRAHLQTQLPPRTTLARSGGDEFVLTVPLTYQSDAARFAFELERAFAVPFGLGERTLQIGASIGVSRFPDDAGTPQALLQAADTAMYAAKADRRAGSGQSYRLYRSEMTEQLEAQLRLEAELKRALAQSEFCLFVQPRFDLKRQQVVASEVLIRWAHPQQGLLLPGAFLEGAQQAGLLPQLDAWVLRRVTRYLSEGAAAGKPARLSCNVSAVSFQDATFLRELEAALGEDPEVSKGLELEVTESLLMQNLDSVAARLADLKGRFPGIRVAIDDFGSGYSSLAYLRYLPIDTLKIDRAFVRDLDHQGGGTLQRTALAVIRTVIALGHDLGFRVVAEGAESEGQLGMLTALGADEVQGFAIGRPQPLTPQLHTGSSAEKSVSPSDLS